MHRQSQSLTSIQRQNSMVDKMGSTLCINGVENHASVRLVLIDFLSRVLRRLAHVHQISTANLPSIHRDCANRRVASGFGCYLTSICINRNHVGSVAVPSYTGVCCISRFNLCMQHMHISSIQLTYAFSLNNNALHVYRLCYINRITGPNIVVIDRRSIYRCSTNTICKNVSRHGIDRDNFLVVTMPNDFIFSNVLRARLFTQTIIAFSKLQINCRCSRIFLCHTFLLNSH